MKRIISLITTFAMIMTLFAGITPASAEESGSITGQVSYIEFGSYPQTEIVGKASQSGTYGKEWEAEGDYEVDSELYTKLQEDTGWNNNDKVISGVKYHRMKKGDAAYSTSGEAIYYNWSNSTTYHYFRYDPIKWRVLDTDGDDAFLLSDIALDEQKYNLSRKSIAWEKSTVRSWLNGYGSSVNSYGDDYTSGNFIDRAFTEEEQTAIIDTELKNKDYEYIDEGWYHENSDGNDTVDKIFLLSLSDISDSVKYGLKGYYDEYDEYELAIKAKSSTYAKAMGVYANTYSDNYYGSWMGNCDWWLRSSASDCAYAAYVDNDGCVYRFDVVNQKSDAIRPALHLNLKANNLFNIMYKDVKVKAGNVALQELSFEYDGTAKTPDVKIPFLVKDKDYTVEYVNNVNPGTAKAIITGIGNCSGSITKEFEIEIPSVISGSLSRDINYDLIEFGSYPQTEIVGEASQSGAYGKEWAIINDYDDEDYEEEDDGDEEYDDEEYDDEDDGDEEYDEEEYDDEEYDDEDYDEEEYDEEEYDDEEYDDEEYDEEEYDEEEYDDEEYDEEEYDDEDDGDEEYEDEYYEGTFEVDSELYSKLQEDTGWNNNDKVISGVKYHRIKLGDATYVRSSSKHYYNWSDSATYHYFRYDPIKWRVLDINGDDAFLLADIALDDQKYNLSSKSITWEKSTVRSWLNGYGSSVNKYGNDYTSGNFIDMAFTEEEQSAIMDTLVKNEDNDYLGTSGGNDTVDKVFLLSLSEVYGSDAVKYGLAGYYSEYDEYYDEYESAVQSKSSTYAKAMGVWATTDSTYLGNCYWWLRSPGEYSSYAAYVDGDGYVSRYGDSVGSSFCGIRPALHLNLKSSNLYSEAGSTGVISTQRISNVKIDSDVYPLNDSKVTPKVSISGLTKGTDYTVSYKDNDKLGIATVVVKGIGRFSGTVKKKFVIADKVDISGMDIEMSSDEYEYAGEPCCPEVKVGALVQDKDYTVTYENNKGAGTGKVIATGKEANGYTGTIEKTFDISKGNISKKVVSIPSGPYSYTGKAIKPAVSIDGLVEGTDFTVSYSNNVNVGTATVTVTGKGYWGGKLTKKFTISRAEVAIPTAKTGLVYNGKAQTGVEAGTGYTVTGNTATAVGTYTAVAKLNENYMWSDGTTGSKNIKWTIGKIKVDAPTAKTGLVYNGKAQTGVETGTGYTVTGNTATSTGKYTAVAKLDANYIWSDGTTGDRNITWSIAAFDISKKTAKLSKTSYVYSGKADKPVVTISGLKSGTDYTVKYSSNVKCGKAKAVITGTGNYKGSITKYFNITPAKSAISKATAGKKKITVKIKSQKAAGVTGYEISYKKAGSKAKSVTTTGTSKVLTKLVKGKKYTVKVRAYKTIDGRKHYGAYSKAKTVKVK